MLLRPAGCSALFCAVTLAVARVHYVSNDPVACLLSVCCLHDNQNVGSLQSTFCFMRLCRHARQLQVPPGFALQEWELKQR